MKKALIVLLPLLLAAAPAHAQSDCAAPQSAVIKALKEECSGDAERHCTMEFEIVQTFARGPMVVNERFDRFTMPQRSMEWHGIGVFMLKNGKIAEWNDYTIQMKA